jgi:hypothetical protein
MLATSTVIKRISRGELKTMGEDSSSHPRCQPKKRAEKDKPDAGPEDVEFRSSIAN